MKKITFLFCLTGIIAGSLHAQTKYIARSGQATIFSHTPAEDIRATNNTVTGIINAGTGDIAISVPVQSFQFEKALMQEHFNNSNFMDSKQFPRILLKGKIANLATVDLSKNGSYEAVIAGDLTIKGITKPVSGKATIKIVNGKLTVNSNLIVKEISSYGVGKPKGKMKNNVAEDIQVTYSASYENGDE